MALPLSVHVHSVLLIAEPLLVCRCDLGLYSQILEPQRTQLIFYTLAVEITPTSFGIYLVVDLFRELPAISVSRQKGSMRYLA